MSRTVSVEILEETIAANLSLYSDKVQEEIRVAVDVRAEELTNELKATSPRQHGKSGGAYARGWKSKVEQNDALHYSRRVYNGKHYMLTHLLENGHACRGGGRTKAQKHIEPAAKKVCDNFSHDVEEAVRDGH